MVVIAVPRTRHNPLGRFASPRATVDSAVKPGSSVCGRGAKVPKLRNQFGVEMKGWGGGKSEEIQETG